MSDRQESAATREPSVLVMAPSKTGRMRPPDVLKMHAQAGFLAYARQPLLAAAVALLEGRRSVEAVRAVAAAHRSLREGIAQDFEATRHGTFEDRAHEAA